MDTFLKSFPCRFPFFSPHCSLPHVLKNVTCIVIQAFHELKGFIIFQYFFGEISSKVVFCAIAMKFIDDFDLIVKILDIFSPLMSWNFDVNVSIYDEFQPAFQLVKLFVYAAQQLIHHTIADNQSYQHQKSDRNQQLLKCLGDNRIYVVDSFIGMSRDQMKSDHLPIFQDWSQIVCRYVLLSNIQYAIVFIRLSVKSITRNLWNTDVKKLLLWSRICTIVAVVKRYNNLRVNRC